jgi:hypothetical protein
MWCLVVDLLGLLSGWTALVMRLAALSNLPELSWQPVSMVPGTGAWISLFQLAYLVLDNWTTSHTRSQRLRRRTDDTFNVVDTR